MIAIKGMDMPKSCGNCNFLQTSSISTNSDVSGFCWDLREYISSTNENPKDCRCRLIALPEENKDMSWEKLKEKCKELKSELLSIRNDCIVYVSFLGGWDCLEFGIDNQIIFKYLAEEKIIHTDKSFYQMWVIIKALIGDER